MAVSSNSRDQRTPVARCMVCRHLETEHGKTGTRPCLAMVGTLLRRDFCSCDRFQSNIPAEIPAAVQKAAQPMARKPAA
ncbi:MAG TPA: hypothetical protein VML19_24590 [Verrucomicrobiae bacterium]|nr:hypothetical protein [Verrucomicrobiae bacterium]